MGLGSVLGGLAGLLIPGGGAMYSAIGSGLGSLIIDKEKPKDAIKNALIAGVGAKFFGPAIQNSGIGGAITRGIGGLGIGTGAGLAEMAGAPQLASAATATIQDTAIQQLASTGAEQAAEKGLMDKIMGGNPMMLYGGLSALGAVEELSNPSGDFGQELFLSEHTGRRFDTAEERDEFDRSVAQSRNETRGYDHYSTAFAMGGYVEGPGTGRSDSIPADIYQHGRPVQKAALSDGEFVMTERAVKGAGDGNREKGAANMYAMMREFERGSA